MPPHTLKHLRLTMIFALLLLTGSALGQFSDEPSGFAAPDPVDVSVVLSADGVHPGGQIEAAIVFEMQDKWHINPAPALVSSPGGMTLVPTTITVADAPPGVQVGEPRWPQPKTIDVDFADEPVRVYAGRTVVVLPITVADSVGVGEQTIRFAVRYQSCDDTTCLFPNDVSLPIAIDVVPPQTAITPTHQQTFSAATTTGAAADAETVDAIQFDFFGFGFDLSGELLLPLLLVAALGGFLLNLTPCVLPLIPIKIMGLSQASEHGSRALLLGVAMFVGVVLFWVALGVVIAFVSGFSTTNQLFQYPAFTIGVGVIIAIMAIGMCGFFSARLPQWVYQINPSQDTIHGSVGFGVMTAVLSTPCTAPFMGAAAAWSATQTPLITLSVFGAIGIGMGLPYLVLAAFPKLVEKMPRTGPASELIKQLMGLLMGAAAAYFIGTGVASLLVTPPEPPTKAYWWAVAAFVAGTGIWLIIRTCMISRSLLAGIVVSVFAAPLIGAAIFGGIALTDEGPIDWVYYTPERLAEAERDGKAVMIDFTAEWCLNCHALERTYLHRKSVVNRLARGDVIPMKVDLTGNNKAGNQLLLEMNRRTIPFLVVLDGDGEVVFRSDAYTDREVLEAIKQATAAAPDAANEISKKAPP